jgi:hypothetical protein
VQGPGIDISSEKQEENADAFTSFLHFLPPVHTLPYSYFEKETSNLFCYIKRSW